jgi:putative copper export protein/mono/diheme cytochrome c family protein
VTPPFDIQGGVPLAFARFVSVACLVTAAGSLFYARVLRPSGLAPAVAVRLRRLCLWSLSAALAGALVWLLAQSQDMAGSIGPDDVWAVLAHTRFGHLLAWRLVLLGLAALALTARAGGLAATLGIGALMLQAGHSHAEAMGGMPVLLGSSILHLLAAGVWLGGLPGLWIVVSGETPRTATAACMRFSVAGMACVTVLLVTAFLQFSDLVMGLPGLVGTAYGWMVGIKAFLFALLIGLAVRNKFSFTPALTGSAESRRSLKRAIAAECAVGLAVLAAAGVLTELQPPMHLQPIWPFAERFSLTTINEDPDFRREVIEAAAALLGAAALLLAALIRRRWRLPATGVAGLVAWFAVPHLSLLLVPAYPTSFYHSPTGFSAASIVQGATLYPAHCAVCHGAQGRGDGKLARALPVPPADLTAGHLWMHEDGELFWWLTDGIDAPRGGKAMPGFGQTLTEGERWALIDYIRANNAGRTFHSDGGWTVPIRAPGMTIRCSARTENLDALHGRFVRLVIGAPAAAGAPSGVTTVQIGGAASPGEPDVCASEDEAAAPALAILTGSDDALSAGTEFLIDEGGWLRATQRPGAPASWANPANLSAAVADLRAHKFVPEPAPAMDMNMKM